MPSPPPRLRVDCPCGESDTFISAATYRALQRRYPHDPAARQPFFRVWLDEDGHARVAERFHAASPVAVLPGDELICFICGRRFSIDELAHIRQTEAQGGWLEDDALPDLSLAHERLQFAGVTLDGSPLGEELAALVRALRDLIEKIETDPS